MLDTHGRWPTLLDLMEAEAAGDECTQEWEGAALTFMEENSHLEASNPAVKSVFDAFSGAPDVRQQQHDYLAERERLCGCEGDDLHAIEVEMRETTL